MTPPEGENRSLSSQCAGSREDLCYGELWELTPPTPLFTERVRNAPDWQLKIPLSYTASGNVPKLKPDCTPALDIPTDPSSDLLDREAIRRTGRIAKLLKRAKASHISFRAQILEFQQERTAAEQKQVEEKASLSKRQGYLKQCRVAAGRGEQLALQKITAVKVLLAAAKEKQARASAARADALQELKSTAFRRQSSGEDLYPLKASTIALQHTNTMKESHTGTENISAIEPRDIGLETCNNQHPATPTFVPTKPSTPTVLPTPPESPESLPESYFPISSSQDEEPSDNTTQCKAALIVPHSTSPNNIVKVQQLSELPRLSSVEHHVCFPKDSKASACESPIGPYVRPPMPIEDMQRCIRCLLGKDKSLKTGNHARAFLGMPWSEIVSFDPDILLARGVSGIKEGSTGMASRLRMMTIIESALSNQNNDSIRADIWERPTFFCESCQQRYPISVDADKFVMTFEEFGEQKSRDAAAMSTLTAATIIKASAKASNKQHNEMYTGGKAEDMTPSTPRKKRSRKKIRGSEVDPTRSAKS